MERQQSTIHTMSRQQVESISKKAELLGAQRRDEFDKKYHEHLQWLREIVPEAEKSSHSYVTHLHRHRWTLPSVANGSRDTCVFVFLWHSCSL